MNTQNSKFDLEQANDGEKFYVVTGDDNGNWAFEETKSEKPTEEEIDEYFRSIRQGVEEGCELCPDDEFDIDAYCHKYHSICVEEYVVDHNEEEGCKYNGCVFYQLTNSTDITNIQ